MDFEIYALMARAKDHLGILLEAMRDREISEKDPTALAARLFLDLATLDIDGKTSDDQRAAIDARLDQEHTVINAELGDFEPPKPWSIMCLNPRSGDPFRIERVYWANSAGEAVNLVLDDIADNDDLNWIGYTADDFRADPLDPDTLNLIEADEPPAQPAEQAVEAAE